MSAKRARDSARIVNTLRPLVGRRGLAFVICAVAALSVGIGVAGAHGSGGGRADVLSRAKARSAQWPTDKASLYEQGILKAFPPNPKPKPAQAQSKPMPAPGVLSVVRPPVRRTGISTLRQAPFGSADFIVTNTYSGLVHGRWYVAYAGALGSNGVGRGEGGVRVLSSDAASTSDITDLGTFPVPGSTSLKFTGFAGDTLTLVDSKTMHTFNLDTLTFG